MINNLIIILITIIIWIILLEWYNDYIIVYTILWYDINNINIFIL